MTRYTSVYITQNLNMYVKFFNATKVQVIIGFAERLRLRSPGPDPDLVYKLICFIHDFGFTYMLHLISQTRRTRAARIG